ncbi:MAG: hypothetical protein JRG91_01840 [Deltaproteobacteria bacterium]|nr:hypothetical protein [Deltaproteobacteria bacterium]
MESRLIAALAACTLIACGGNGTPSGDASTEADMDASAETTSDTPVETTPDAPPPDGETEPVEDAPVDSPEDVPVDEGPDAVMGTCTGWPSTSSAYTFDIAAVVDSISLPMSSGGFPTCCRDFGTISADYIERGTHNIDNSLAELLAALEMMGGPDFEVTMNAAISSGALNILLEHRGLDGETDADGFCLVRFNGAPAGSAGHLAYDTFFVTGTGTPLETFPASMSSGDMLTARGSFEMLIPLAVPVTAKFEDAELTGTATVSTPGVTYSAGTLSGYVTLDEFFSALNDYVQTDCACLSAPDPVFRRLSDGTVEEHCTDLTPSTCAAAGNDTCAALGTNCSTLVPLFVSAADLELESTRTGYDAISFGMAWTAVPATISGVTTP